MQVTIVFGLFSWSCSTTSHLLVRFWRVWLIQAGEKLESYLALWLSDLYQVTSLSISHTKHSLVRLANDLANIFGPPSRYEQSQPINYVDDQLPPMLLVHGENDTTVYVKNSRNLARAASRAGAPDVTLLVYPNLTHARLIAALSSPLRGLSGIYDDIDTWIRAKAGLPAAPARE